MSASPSPICVADNFHFSHYYWRSWDLIGVEASDDEDGEAIVPGAADAASDNATNNSDSDSDSISDSSSSAIYKPKELKAEVIRLKFYSNVLDDGSNNIHFGKWDGIALDDPDAYGRAAEQMTDWMFDLAMNLMPHRKDATTDFSYVDLGSGTGASALRIAEKHLREGSAHCLNLCHAQNIEAAKLARQRGLSDRVEIVEGNFENAPADWSDKFDLAFSQDAFIHALSKRQVYDESFRITKPGGAFVFCDLMAGENPDLTEAEQQKFAEQNVLNDFLTPTENRVALDEAGWREIHWIDLTTDVRISFQLMLKKVHFLLEHGEVSSNNNRVLLSNFSQRIRERIVQIDRGVFKWCAFHARKPVALRMDCLPPVPFVNTSSLIIENENDIDNGDGTTTVDYSMPTPSVVVVDIVKKMPREKIEALPSTVKLLITMSAGLDHIDLRACSERGISVQNSGRDAITSHVVQYTLAFLIIGLRDALNQIGVPFPSSGWNLNWNCDSGVPLTDAKIAIVGLGMIAIELIRQIRLLAPETTIMYHVPESFRDIDAEGKYNLVYCGDLGDMASKCDILAPLCPLNSHTEHLVDGKVLGRLQPHAGLLNFARGKIVDTDALTSALQNKTIKYAILDTTFPEPLPQDHPLWNIDNCFIMPHYATNTMAVRKALVEEIQPIIEDHFGLGHSDEKLRQQEQALRFDLAVAHRLTAKLGMDMLVWNHISARHRTGCLITPGRKLWSQVRPEDLVLSSSNVTADIIHGAVYGARSDIQAVIHLHTPAATAVSCLETGFIPMTQDAAYFYNRVAHYEWDGLSDDAAEGPAITAAVRAIPGCNTLLMHNHGYVCFGKSIKEAWVLAYYFERCCDVQLRVLQSGGKVKMPSARVMAAAAESSYLPEFAPGACEWDALCKDVTFDDEGNN